jgi:hypothetical protein
MLKPLEDLRREAMTEAEWLTSEDCHSLLYSARGSERKFRLFACACCRRVWHWLVDPRSQAAVEAAERFADGQVTTAQLAWARRAAQDRADEPIEAGDVPGFHFDVPEPPEHAAAQAAAEAANSEPRIAALLARSYVETAFARVDEALSSSGVLEASREAAELRELVSLLRDIFVNPFRPPAFDPRWRTTQMIALAQAAYAERALPAGTLDSTRLAVLADALEDVGADALLEHLRGSGPHVRGCWVLDLCLGR